MNIMLILLPERTKWTMVQHDIMHCGFYSILLEGPHPGTLVSGRPVMAAEVVDSYEITIRQHDYWALPFRVENPENFVLFEVNVNQNLDIKACVLDDGNFKTWTHNFQALQAGARVERLPTVEMYSSMTLRWGTLSFKPQERGVYHLVLDNTYSILTPKKIMLTIYRLQVEDPVRRSVRETALHRGWHDVWASFEHAEGCLSRGNLASCCDNLRRGLINLWIKVCEALSGEPVYLDAGKATDVGQLKERLKAYTPEYSIAPVTQAWSLASELSKTERRAGVEPPLNQVVLAYRMTYAAAAFLVSIQVGVMPTGEH